MIAFTARTRQFSAVVPDGAEGPATQWSVSWVANTRKPHEVVWGGLVDSILFIGFSHYTRLDTVSGALPQKVPQGRHRRLAPPGPACR